MTNAQKIAEGLTTAQRLALIEGCSCGKGPEMVELGLWVPDRKLGGPPYYLDTPLGLEVRALLQERQP
jgi:hypothetical protein